jgi:hypothetical protein
MSTYLLAFAIGDFAEISFAAPSTDDNSSPPQTAEQEDQDNSIASYDEDVIYENPNSPDAAQSGVATGPEEAATNEIDDRNENGSATATGESEGNTEETNAAFDNRQRLVIRDTLLDSARANYSLALQVRAQTGKKNC